MKFWWRGGGRPSESNEIGLVEIDSADYWYLARGKVFGSPYQYQISAIPVVRSPLSAEATAIYSKIVETIEKSERRQIYKTAIKNLLKRPGNVFVDIVATTSTGKTIRLLELPICVRSPYLDSRATTIRICQFIKTNLETIGDRTRQLDPVSAGLIRGALFYSSMQTKQFWINTAIYGWILASAGDRQGP